MRTFDEAGYVEPGPVYFQVKASDALQTVETALIFDVDIRDYNLWIREEVPVLLVLFDALNRKGYWLCVQQYFDSAEERQPKKRGENGSSLHSFTPGAESPRSQKDSRTQALIQDRSGVPG